MGGSLARKKKKKQKKQKRNKLLYKVTYRIRDDVNDEWLWVVCYSPKRFPILLPNDLASQGPRKVRQMAEGHSDTEDTRYGYNIWKGHTNE